MSTILPAVVLTVTEVSEILATVPVTCSIPPWATARAANSDSASASLMMMFVRASIEKFPFFLLFLQFIRSLWIQFIHFKQFLLGHLRKMADKADQLPGIRGAVAGSAPAGHAGEANAV